MPFFKTCCGNVDLARGCILIGSVEVFLNVIILFGFLKFHIAKYVIVDSEEYRYHLLPSANYSIMTDTEKNRLFQVKYFMVFVYSTLKCFTIIAAVLLIFGAQNNQRKLVIPYLFVGLLNIIYAIFVLVMSLIYIPHPSIFSIICYYILLTSTFFYLWLCVFSFYQRIKENEIESLPSVGYTAQPPPGYEHPPSYSTFNLSKKAEGGEMVKITSMGNISTNPCYSPSTEGSYLLCTASIPSDSQCRRSLTTETESLSSDEDVVAEVVKDVVQMGSNEE